MIENGWSVIVGIEMKFAVCIVSDLYHWSSPTSVIYARYRLYLSDLASLHQLTLACNVPVAWLLES